MKKIAAILLLFLVGCSEEKRTKISYPADFIKNELTTPCEDKKKADCWLVLTEHNRFKCMNGLAQGSRKCYGWYLHAYCKCEVKGVGQQTLKYEHAISFGNSDLEYKDEQ